jgi:hypothetical protein
MNMAGRPPELKNIKRELLEKIKSTESFIKIIKEVPPVVTGSRRYRFNSKQKEQLVGLLFINIVAAWEKFLEESLVRYLTGNVSGKYEIVLKEMKKISVLTARADLAGIRDYDPEKNYINLSDIDTVLRKANKFFSKHPYVFSEDDVKLLKYATAIRNRVAHSSIKSRNSFKETVNTFSYPLSSGYSPGKFLIDPVKLPFGNYSLPDEHSHFEAYLKMYEALANTIVPG